MSVERRRDEITERAKGEEAPRSSGARGQQRGARPAGESSSVLERPGGRRTGRRRGGRGREGPASLPPAGRFKRGRPPTDRWPAGPSRDKRRRSAARPPGGGSEVETAREAAGRSTSRFGDRPARGGPWSQAGTKQGEPANSHLQLVATLLVSRCVKPSFSSSRLLQGMRSGQLKQRRPARCRSEPVEHRALAGQAD